jgi:hypothetical protein
MDFSALIPPGVGIVRGTLQILTNTAVPAPTDLVAVDPTGVLVQDRVLYARVRVSSAAGGQDFQLLWTADDTDENVWPRTALALCAPTS